MKKPFRRLAVVGTLTLVVLAGLILGQFAPAWAAQPTLVNPIPNQVAPQDWAFNFQFAANTFEDPDDDTLTYFAQLAGGGMLPGWLSFNSATRMFSGTPSNAHVGTVSIDMIALDGNGGIVTNTFDIEVTEVAAFSGAGAGNIGDRYVITTCGQLQEVSYEIDGDAWYLLGNDIDCSQTAHWNGGSGFVPIGDSTNPFLGVLESAGYTISGLTINRPSTDYVGLFGYIGNAGTAQGFMLTDVSITGRDYVGGVAGQTLNGDVYNVGVYGEIVGEERVGGIVGRSGAGVMNAHSHASISGSPVYAGGLVGENNGFIWSSYSTGSIVHGPFNGGLTGYNTGTVTDSFWNTETSTYPTSFGGTGKTTAELKNIATFTDTETIGLNTAWNFEQVWAIHELINDGYPYIANQILAVPETLLTFSPSSPSNSRDLSFQFATNVDGSTFECRIEPNSYAPCTSPYESTVSTDGEYIFSVRATNANDLTDQSPAEITILVDTDAPTTGISMTDPPIGRNTAVYEFNSDEQPSTFECSFNGADFEACTSPYTTPVLTDGEFTLQVRATDEAGNVEDPPASDTFMVALDTDGDSIVDAVENAGPNSGDANNDEILDSEQPIVASFVNPVTGYYQVIVANACDNFIGIMTGAEADDPADANYDYPMGLTAFYTLCGGPGQIGSFEQYFYGVEGNSSYIFRKWIDGEYSTMEGAVFEGVLIDDQVVFRVSYQIEDGDENDEDGVADGYIRDPAGPALLVASTPGSSSGSDSSSTSSSNGLAGTGQSTQAFYLMAFALISLSSASLVWQKRRS